VKGFCSVVSKRPKVVGSENGERSAVKWCDDLGWNVCII